MLSLRMAGGIMSSGPDPSIRTPIYLAELTH